MACNRHTSTKVDDKMQHINRFVFQVFGIVCVCVCACSCAIFMTRQSQRQRQGAQLPPHRCRQFFFVFFWLRCKVEGWCSICVLHLETRSCNATRYTKLYYDIILIHFIASFLLVAAENNQSGISSFIFFFFFFFFSLSSLLKWTKWLGCIS